MSLQQPRSWPIIERWFPHREAWSRPVHAGWLLTVFVLLGGLPYTVINQIAGQRNTSVFHVETSLDTMLPFVPWMMVPYVSFYAYFPLMFWMGSRVDRRPQAERLTLRLVQATWIAFAIFLLLPVEVDLRHQITPVEGVLGLAFDTLHTWDTPYNAWPSLHVLQSLLVVLTVRTWLAEEARAGAPIYGLIWAAWGLLVLSTLLVKQHYLFDVATAIVLAATVWKVWFKPTFN